MEKFSFMRYVIDRFENNFAICEDELGNFVRIEKDKLPQDSFEGTVLLCQEGIFVKDMCEEKARRARIRAKLSKILNEDSKP